MSTMLDDYMSANDIKDADFAPRIGRERSVVSKIRRGLIRPTLEIAAAIETETGGAVPMRAWLPIDQANAA